MSESDFTRLIAGLKKYDEEDLKQHQKKLWVLIGLATGPRGQEQHTFEVHHIEKDVCGPEYAKKGMVYYAFVGLDHKRGKLTTTSCYADDDDAMKMLLYCNKKDGLCAASCLERYLDKLAPGQTRLYCRVKKDNTMSALQPMGRNTCSKMVKEIGMDCGIVDMKKWKPHVFRHQFLTLLANDASLNLAEVMAAGRHKSVSASLAYQRRCEHSEAAKFDSIERALKRGAPDDEDEVDANAGMQKKMKLADSKVAALKSVMNDAGAVIADMPKSEKKGMIEAASLDHEGGGDDNDDNAMVLAAEAKADPSAKADSSPPTPVSGGGDKYGGPAKPVSFTFHFN